MDRTKLILKPSLFNAIVPLFLQSVGYSILLALLARAIIFLPEALGLLRMDYTQTVFLMGGLIVVFTILPLAAQIFFLYFTTYYFYETHVTKEFRFLGIKKRSVPYKQITKVNMEISIWDRLCGAGDILLHTADDNTPDLILMYIPHPQKAEQNLYKILEKGK